MLRHRGWVWLCGAAIIVLSGMLGYHMLAREVERLSYIVTLKLGLEVVILCVVLSAIPAYVALRGRVASSGARLLVGAAILSLLIPTIARSLAFSALFAYYAPLANFLRRVGLWPQGRPLESSHLAVVISLVTLYLPVALIVLAHGVRHLGRSPEIASTLGAGPWRRLWYVIIPGLSRPLVTAGLIVFSQTIGVIITPRILGSDDITLAVLTDELMKQSLDTTAAMRVAAAELALAIPMAAMAAMFLDVESIKRLVPPGRRRRSATSLLVSMPVTILLFLPSAVLILLSVARSPVLSMGALVTRGATLHWYSQVVADPAWRSIIGPSLLVWLTAALSAILLALILGQASLQRPRMRSVFRVVALTLLFIPQNALGVVLFLILAQLPQGLVGSIPGWVLGGLGQAVPGFALAYVLIDGALQRIKGSTRVAATLGASWWQRSRRIIIPQIVPTLTGMLVVSALITLDDVIFVRYLPRTGLSTFSTELFARARFTSSPDLAAACVLLWLVVLIVWGAIPVYQARMRIRIFARKLLGSHAAFAQASDTRLTP